LLFRFQQTTTESHEVPQSFACQGRTWPDGVSQPLRCGRVPARAFLDPVALRRTAHTAVAIRRRVQKSKRCGVWRQHVPLAASAAGTSQRGTESQMNSAPLRRARQQHTASDDRGSMTPAGCVKKT
jgi:hypothetical protein